MDRRFPSGLAFVSACLLVLAFGSFAQEEAPPPPSAASAPSDSTPADASYGNAEGPQVQTGTRFLVSLQDALSTTVDKRGKRFTLRTLEPLVTLDGTRLPTGAEIRARVSRVDAPNQNGRGRLWLAFDDIHTPGGRIPIVAGLFDIPSDRIVKVGKNHESEVEARNNPAGKNRSGGRRRRNGRIHCGEDRRKERCGARRSGGRRDRVSIGLRARAGCSPRQRNQARTHSGAAVDAAGAIALPEFVSVMV